MEISRCLQIFGSLHNPTPSPQKKGGAPRFMHDLPIDRSSDDSQAPVTLLARGS